MGQDQEHGGAQLHRADAQQRRCACCWRRSCRPFGVTDDEVVSLATPTRRQRDPTTFSASICQSRRRADDQPCTCIEIT